MYSFDFDSAFCFRGALQDAIQATLHVWLCVLCRLQPRPSDKLWISFWHCLTTNFRINSWQGPVARVGEEARWQRACVLPQLSAKALGRVEALLELESNFAFDEAMIVGKGGLLDSQSEFFEVVLRVCKPYYYCLVCKPKYVCKPKSSFSVDRPLANNSGLELSRKECTICPGSILRGRRPGTDFRSASWIIVSHGAPACVHKLGLTRSFSRTLSFL